MGDVYEVLHKRLDLLNRLVVQQRYISWGLAGTVVLGSAAAFHLKGNELKELISKESGDLADEFRADKQLQEQVSLTVSQVTTALMSDPTTQGAIVGLIQRVVLDPETSAVVAQFATPLSSIVAHEPWMQEAVAEFGSKVVARLMEDEEVMKMASELFVDVLNTDPVQAAGTEAAWESLSTLLPFGGRTTAKKAPDGLNVSIVKKGDDDHKADLVATEVKQPLATLLNEEEDDDLVFGSEKLEPQYHGAFNQV